MQIMPVEKCYVVTPQTPLKFLGQNLFGDHFGGQSEAGKLWPQATLGPGANGLTGGLPLDLKKPGAKLSQPPIGPKNGLQTDFSLRI